MSGDELVDIVDNQDRVIGQATRSDVRRLNLLHRCVYVLVFNSAGQLFVHQRTTTKDVFPGYWDVTVGGVVAAGEDYTSAAYRELAEEIGVRDVPVRRLFSSRYEDPRNRALGAVYSCTTDQVGPLQASEVACGEWVDLIAVIERMQQAEFCPDGLEVLRLYLAKLDAARARRGAGRPQ